MSDIKDSKNEDKPKSTANAGLFIMGALWVVLFVYAFYAQM